MSNVKHYKHPVKKTVFRYEMTNEEMKEFRERQHKMEREINKAAEAGLFLTAADLNE